MYVLSQHIRKRGNRKIFLFLSLRMQNKLFNVDWNISIDYLIFVFWLFQKRQYKVNLMCG